MRVIAYIFSVLTMTSSLFLAFMGLSLILLYGLGFIFILICLMMFHTEGRLLENYRKSKACDKRLLKRKKVLSFLVVIGSIISIWVSFSLSQISCYDSCGFSDNPDFIFALAPIIIFAVASTLSTAIYSE